MLTVYCPKCKKKYFISDKKIDEKFLCRKCHDEFIPSKITSKNKSKDLIKKNSEKRIPSNLKSDALKRTQRNIKKGLEKSQIPSNKKNLNTLKSDALKKTQRNIRKGLEKSQIPSDKKISTTLKSDALKKTQRNIRRGLEKSKLEAYKSSKPLKNIIKNKILWLSILLNLCLILYFSYFLYSKNKQKINLTENNKKEFVSENKNNTKKQDNTQNPNNTENQNNTRNQNDTKKQNDTENQNNAGNQNNAENQNKINFKENNAKPIDKNNDKQEENFDLLDEAKITNSKVIFQGWFSAKYLQKKIAFIHIIYKKINYDGKAAYQLIQNGKRVIKREGQSFSWDFFYNKIVLEDMTPILSTSKVTQSSQKKITITSFEKDVVKRKIIIDGISHAKENKINEKIILDDFLYAKKLNSSGELAIGKIFEYLSINEEQLEVMDSVLVVLDKKEIDFEGKKIKIWEIGSSGKSKFSIDEEGMIFNIKTETYELIKCSREEAEIFDDEYNIKISFPTNYIFNEQHITKMDLILNTRNSKTLYNKLKDKPYQKLSISKEGLHVHINENHPEPYRRSFPERNKQFENFLISEPDIQCKDPSIRNKAMEIIGTTKDRYRAVKLLQKWVFYNIRKASTNILDASATETLKSMAGDCTEHAKLFCAMARSLGIPARVSVGAVYLNGEFGLHAWNEVYIGDWLLIDCALDREGVNGKYILFGNIHEDSPGEITSIFLSGEIEIKILKYWKGEKEYSLIIEDSNNKLTNNRQKELEDEVMFLSFVKLSEISDSKKTASIYFELAEIYINKNNKYQAMMMLERGLQLDSTRLKYQYIYAILLTEDGNFTKSGEYFKYVSKNSNDSNLKKQADMWLDKIGYSEEKLINLSLPGYYIYIVGFNTDNSTLEIIADSIEKEYGIEVKILSKSYKPSQEIVINQIALTINYIEMNYGRKALLEMAKEVGISEKELDTEEGRKKFFKLTIGADEEGRRLLNEMELNKDACNSYYMEEDIKIQYNWLFNKAATLGIIVVTDNKVSDDVDEYIFGYDSIESRISIISTYRFKEDNISTQLYHKRLLIKAFASVGVILGLTSCNMPQCSRTYSKSLEEYDKRNCIICQECRKNLLKLYKKLIYINY